MKQLTQILILFFSMTATCQEKNFIDKPYIEVEGKSDTLVTPNRIYIDVLITEKDTKGKKSVEDLEKEMFTKLQVIGIDVKKDVFMKDMLSTFKKYFLKSTDIQKSKSYSILVFDATQTTKVFIGLEEIGISNVNIEKTEHSESEKIQLKINSKAIENAKATAESYLNPLNQKVGKAIFIGHINTTNMLQGNVSGVLIRGNRSLYEQESKGYISPIEFEKIKISSNVGVRFSID
ncbi:SIMPL domain-containing protein [uncultured Flavobacterium sp.]|mgnify:FL=1|uniref:SIMPL domain-containing protein n=1 Tax=uncultured Flavobacterium sp. TaxID=165435 RepID=UPI002591551C|nr:SIMPL domain-containing protein [uncultured Flavobacterium sp.]